MNAPRSLGGPLYRSRNLSVQTQAPRSIKPSSRPRSLIGSRAACDGGGFRSAPAATAGRNIATSRTNFKRRPFMPYRNAYHGSDGGKKGASPSALQNEYKKYSIYVMLRSHMS